MTNSEFEDYLDNANDDLRRKQDALQTEYGMGSFSRWWFEQATAKLQFFDDKDHLSLEADIIDIGSYSSKSSTWKWAWSNETVLHALRVKSEKLKELEGVTGFDLFSTESAFEIDGEEMAWEFTALAVQHLGAIGAYRAPSSSGGSTSFFAITSIRSGL
jgi:hypothetical protein